MTRRFAFVVVLAVISVVHLAAQSPSLRGAWKVVSITTADGKVNNAPEPGLYLFTDRHYSIQTVNAPRPAAAGQNSPDKDRLAAYDAFTANTGTYEVKGATYTTRPIVAKNPSVMTGTGPGAASEIRFEGTSVVYLSSPNPGGNGKTVRKLQRLE
jgi:hypothetical protein